MEIKRIISYDMLSSNCYLVTNDGESLVIDPGEYGRELDEALKPLNYKLKYILLTHTHFDHIGGTAELKEKTGAKVCAHALDAAGLNNYLISLANIGGVRHRKTEADVLLKDGQELCLGGEKIRVMHTPGHSPGGVCYIMGDNIFTGDTLFAGTVGRTDFPGGDYGRLIASLQQLSELEGDYTIYPGHGEDTTMENERKNNPYMRQLDETDFM